MRYFTIVLALAILWTGGPALAADFVLITNKATPVTVVSQTDVKNFYLGKKTSWGDGSRVTVYTQSDSAVHDAFMKSVVQKTPQQYATYWKKSLFTGTGLPPKDFADDASVKQAVASQAGAVGYISVDALDATVKKLDIN